MKRRPAHLRTQQLRTECETKRTHALICVPADEVFADIVPERAQQDGELARLAASIARHGLLQPIVVRRDARKGGYALVCGARRLAACRLLGMKEIDALLISADAAQAVACFLEEHETHMPPHFLYAAHAVRRVGVRKVEAACVLDGGYIRRLLSALELGQRTQEIAKRANLSLGQALPLLHLRSESRQTEAASIIAQRSLTAQQARRLVFGARSIKSCGSAGKREK